MQRPDHRSQAFAAALKRELDSRLQPGGHDCPDDAALAAYVDRSAGVAERARLDAHCSNCVRCQKVLAAMARAADVANVSAGHPSAMRWGLYGAVAAALAGVSIAVTVISTRHVPMMALRAPKDLGAPMAAKRSQPPAVIALNQPPSNARMERESASETVESKSLAPQRLARAGPKLKSAMVSKEVPRRAEEPLRNELAVAAPAVAAPPKPAIAAPARPLAGAASAPPPIAASAPPAFESASSDAGIAGQRDVPRAVAGGLAMQSSRFAMGKAAAPAPMVSIHTADGIERWRLGPNGTILHREPDGTWQTQAAGVAATLNAGVAPSPEVCWVAGSNGIVLRTTDGVHWQRLESPTTSDLISIFAASASDATITAANGQRFATGDGGQTWRPLM